MSDIVIVTTAVADAASAKRLASAIIAARLASCVQFFPIHSIYRWKGKVESAREVSVVCKTTQKLSSKLVKFIRAKHSYELPEIVVTPVLGGLQEYLDWVEAEVREKKSVTR